MRHKKIVLLSIVLPALAAVCLLEVVFYYKKDTTTYIDTTSGINRYMNIESYIQNNISILSPIQETLGGTFYVTRIETHGGSGVVYYEDGHNAYTADFIYSVDEKGKPSVHSFTVRK